MREEVSMHPTGAGERIHLLDFLRGFSLFGVLLVNMTLFKTTLFDYPRRMLDYTYPMDQWISLVIQVFINGKFISILSFLFGLGFLLFMERAEERGLSVVPLYRRRLLLLFLFGIFHLVFIWNGDILHTYALAGLLLLWLRKKSMQSLLRWMKIFFVFSTVIAVLSAGLEYWARYLLEGELLQQQALLSKTAFTTYGGGSFWEITRFRLIFELPNIAIGLIYTVPYVMVLFLAGLCAGRHNILRDPEGNLPLIKKVWKITGLVGILLTVFYVCIELNVFMFEPLAAMVLLEVSKHISAILLSLFYISSLLLLLAANKLSRRLLAPFSYLGRMTLTNYLMQSLICVFIFYGFGLGYLGRVSLLQVLLLTLFIYIFQLYLSYLWLRSFAFGPMEWLWRSFTYKKKIKPYHLVQ